MERHLIKTVNLQNGKLYEIIGGDRFLLANCGIKLEIYEERYNVPMLGGCGVKKQRVQLSICDNLDPTRPIEVESLNNVQGFNIQAEYRRTDGVFETMKFYNITPLDIELGGKWLFEVKDMELIEKLLKI